MFLLVQNTLNINTILISNWYFLNKRFLVKIQYDLDYIAELATLSKAILKRERHVCL